MQTKKKLIKSLCTIGFCFVLAGCAFQSNTPTEARNKSSVSASDESAKKSDTTTEKSSESSSRPKTSKSSSGSQSTSAKASDPKKASGSKASDPKQPSESRTSGQKSQKKKTSSATKTSDPIVITIDPGHQAHQDLRPEKIGPKSRGTKPRVSSGTQGVVTRIPEYKFTLRVAKKLRTQLKARGYKVYMTRTKNNVSISNVQRAKIANKHHSDLYIRIHADGASNRSQHGVSVLCMSKNNPNNGRLHAKSYRLSKDILNQVCKKTGARKIRVDDSRDDLSGNNWCKCPVSLIECGFMSNPTEDRRLAKDSYQKKIAAGIANGIDQYVKQSQKK